MIDFSNDALDRMEWDFQSYLENMMTIYRQGYWAYITGGTCPYSGKDYKIWREGYDWARNYIDNLEREGGWTT